MGYKEKLTAFNKGATYNEELRFLGSLLDIKLSDVIVDYGCGTGYGVQHMKDKGADVYGYDANDYRSSEYPERYFVDQLPDKIDKVYFMHSYSHIPNIDIVLRYLHDRLSEEGRIYIIAPNPTWINTFENVDYKPDPTVVRHNTHVEIFQQMNNAGFNMVLEGQLGNLRQNVHERVFAIYQKKYE